MAWIATSLLTAEAAVNVAVSPSADAIGQLNNDALDAAAFEAIRDDHLEAAENAFAEIISRDSEDAFAALWLGTVAIRKWDLGLAEKAFAHAVKTVDNRMWVEDENEGFALGAKRSILELSLRRVRERLAALDAKAAHAARSESSTDLLRRLPIRRVHYRDLGQAEFESSHAEAGVPVIVTGFESLAGAMPWSFEHLRATCGHLSPRVVQYNPRSATWAGMHLARRPPASFAEYLDSLTIDNGDDNVEDRGVVFDWGLRLEGGCRDLLSTFAVPSYFTHTIVAGYGPGLFVQPNGTKCGLHFDTGSTHFWQYLWQGAKRWRVFKTADWPRLFEPHAWRRAFFRDARCSGLFGPEAMQAANCEDGFGAVAVDGFDDDALRKLADGAPLEYYEAELQPGELIFVPSRAPHQVINVAGPAVAISMNYVDFTNLEARERWHLENAGVHDKFRSRLNKSGEVIPGSKTRWYERFKMPVASAEFRRVSAAVQHVAHQLENAPQRGDAAFLDPWEELAKRPWNLQVASD